MSPQERSSFANGIWLCRRCHKIVDSDHSPFGAVTLRQWKQDAEKQARKAVEFSESTAALPALVSVLHKSMENIPNGALRASMPDVFAADSNLEVVVDACDLYSGGVMQNPLEAMQRQVDKRNELVEVLNTHQNIDVAYYGIAHVPLTFHLGFLLSTKISPHFAERERTANEWRWLSNDDSSVEFQVTRPEGGWSGESDAAIRIGVSYPVTPEQTNPVVESCATFGISVVSPAVDIVRTRKDVERLAASFRGVIDELVASSSIQRIHVFASVPMCVAFAMGQQISASIHPKVYVYNYRRQDSPNYKWGALMTDDTTAQDAIIINE
ncbi:SAVED domain-containing protein [Patescibacteria group bacterium]